MLPRINGTYHVATSFWSIPFAKRVFGTAKFKSSQLPVFALEEAGVQVFYPCEKPQSRRAFGVEWLHRVLTLDILPYRLLLSAIIKMPLFRDTPLKAHPDGAEWPLVIFSHGLAGTRTTYSQICSRIAAQGYVVLAIEHRDGTGPSSIYPIDGKRGPHYYLNVQNLDWDEKLKNPETPMPLRTQQLDVRYVEILEVFKAFKEIVSGNDSVVTVSSIIFTGHSFGGCTGFHILTHSPPKGYDCLPISKAIIHDPWMEPFPADFEQRVVRENQAFSIPVIVINSEEFTLWKSHFVRQDTLLKPWVSRAGENAAFVTLVGSRHMAFSDFPLITPLNKQRAIAYHDDIHELSMAFLEGRIPAYLKSIHKRATMTMSVENPDDKKRKKIKASPETIIIHHSSLPNNAAVSKL
ncbi:SubName: Full=Uncharacterized protein {ECO:0000313/EMBL:CCA70463.1} [Serendipita indica DSM 11827]|nr:SubName: Full=Uncharacterized protein {ECO:0000313/EMBL:CCA70463.1} [Serendipita indica DSM 11827]